MSDALKRIDTDLTASEQRLLDELRRLRKLGSDETYSKLERDVKLELDLTLDALSEALAHSGASQLSLETNEHESTRERIAVARSILRRKVPTAFLATSHDEAKIFRKDKEQPDHPAKELALLDEQLRLHHIDGKSINEIVQSRAQFDARELTHGHLEAKSRRNIAQSPEEIRRKLAESGTTTTGSSTFAAKELTGAVPQPATPAPPSTRRSSNQQTQIAQSPDEIRLKLAERQKDASKQAASGSSKAVFGARDIDHVQPLPQKPRDKDAGGEKVKAPPVEPGGKAIFEARDLSKPKA